MNPVNIYMFKVNNRNNRTRYQICSKLTIKTPGVFIVNFEHISHHVLVFLIVNFEKVYADWEELLILGFLPIIWLSFLVQIQKFFKMCHWVRSFKINNLHYY